MSDFGNFGNYGDGDFDGTDGGRGGFQSDGIGSQKQQVKSSLTPVTIKQINESKQEVPDSDFKIHNVELNFVSFIGVVRKVDNNTSAIIITVEDGTGTIDVRKWIDDQVSGAAEESEKYEKELNKYVSVSGALKEFNGKKNIQNATIRAVNDSNEILYHNLSAISTHLRAQGVTAATSTAGKQEGLFVSDANDREESKPLIDRALDVIREYTPTMAEGVPSRLIAQKLGISDDAVLKISAELCDTGKVYGGYDDTSFFYI